MQDDIGNRFIGKSVFLVSRHVTNFCYSNMSFKFQCVGEIRNDNYPKKPNFLLIPLHQNEVQLNLCLHCLRNDETFNLQCRYENIINFFSVEITKYMLIFHYALETGINPYFDYRQTMISLNLVETNSLFDF